MINKSKLSKSLTVIVFFAMFSFVFITDSSKFNFNFKVAEPSQVYAAAANWAAVRGLAGLIRTSNQTVKGIADAIIASGVMNISGNTFSGATTNTYGTYFIKITKGVNRTIDGTSYPNVLEEWQGTSIDATKKSLEFFYDDITEPSAGSGILMRIAPGLYSSTYYNTSEMNETKVAKNSDGKIYEYISFSDGPFKSWANAETGRALLVDEGDNVSVSYLAKTSLTSITGLTCGGGKIYYTLAFIAKEASPNYSTAKYGVSDTSITDAWCNLSNTDNYGYFKNVDGTGTFEQDGVSTDDGDHPAMADVQSLFTKMQSNTKLSITTVGALDINFESTTSVASKTQL